MTGALHSMVRRQDGAVTVITALLMTVLLGMGALAIDIASFRLTQRQLQAATDAAALAGTYALMPDAVDTNQQDWVDKYLAGKLGVNGELLSNYQGPGIAKAPGALKGYYCPVATIIPTKDRFQTENKFPGFPDGCPVYPVDPDVAIRPNAVRVTSQTTSPLYLGRVLTPSTGDVPIVATATAAQIPQAGFYAGSGLLSLNNGILNAVLSGLLGGGIDLTLADYNGLLNANVSAFQFFKALATRVGVQAGTYGSVLQAPVTMHDVLQAEVDALNAPESVAKLGLSAVGAATDALVKLNGQITGSPQINLADLFDLGVWQSQGLDNGTAQTALQTALNVYQLATLAAQVADGSNFANIPSFNVDVLGLATLSVQATVIEPKQPAIAFGPEGVSVHTSQVRLQLALTVPVASNPLLTLLLGSSPIQLPVYIEVAEGDAKLAQVSCGTNPATDAVVTIDATPGVAKAYIGTAVGAQITDFSHPIDVDPAQILNASLTGGLVTVKATGKAVVSAGPAAATLLVFTQTDITNGTAQRVTSNGHLFSSLLSELMAPGGDADDGLVVSVSGLVGGLLGGLTVNVSTVTAALSGLLTPIFTDLDSVIGQVMAALGVSVGYLDVTATGVRCGAPVLVN
jgi:uncharacterized membrane protein